MPPALSWFGRPLLPVPSGGHSPARRALRPPILHITATGQTAIDGPMIGDPGGIRTLDLRRERATCWASTPQGQAGQRSCYHPARTTRITPRGSEPSTSELTRLSSLGRALVRDGQARLPPSRAAPQRRGIPLVHPPTRAKDEGAPKDQYAGRRRFEDEHGSPPGTEGYRAAPSAEVRTFVFFSYLGKSRQVRLLRLRLPLEPRASGGNGGPQSTALRSPRHTR